LDSNKNILVDLIADVVDSMRATNTIDSFIENSGVYTITSANELKSKEVIVIDSIDYIVEVIDENSFTINADTGLDFTGKTWKALAPYYEHGHILEIANTLKKKKDGIYAFKKYPLIILFEDHTYSKSTTDTAIFGTVPARIAIANHTNPTLNSSERYESNFRPILFPLYDKFMDALVSIDYFKTIPDKPYVDHDMSPRPYWGSNLPGDNSNVLDDWIDAIDLENVQLQILNGIQTC
jgi:hypothetical protein